LSSTPQNIVKRPHNRFSISYEVYIYPELTVWQLEEKVRQRIQGEFKERISLQTECDLFIRCALADVPSRSSSCLNQTHSVAFAAIIALLRELEAVCEPALATLTRTIWINHELVTGQSPYVDDLIRALESITEAIVPLVESKKYLRNFFDKAAR
jgi:vacuolar protein sorting-associated protein 53